MSKRLFAGYAHQLRNDVITWAGVCPWNLTPAFGTDKGNLHVALGTGGGRKKIRDTVSQKASSEPINSVAFLTDYAATSSRTEVTILKRAGEVKREGANRKIIRDTKTFDFGGHNVVSLRNSDTFLIAANSDGIVALRPGEKSINIRTLRTTDYSLPVYKVTTAGRHADGGELIAAACRQAGVLVFAFHENDAHGHAMLHGFPGQDIIDIQPVNHSAAGLPRAAVALSADGTLFFIPDLIEKRPPSFMEPAQSLGDVFNLLVCGDSVFVLTHERLIFLPSLIRGWTNGGLQASDSGNGLSIFLEASDLLPFGRKSFAVLTEKHAITFEASTFLKSATSDMRIALGSRRDSVSEFSRSFGARWKVSSDKFAPSNNPWDTNAGLPMDRIREEEGVFA